MKSLHQILAAVAATVVFSATVSAHENEAHLSPRGKANQSGVFLRGSSGNDLDFVHTLQYGNGRGLALANDFKRIDDMDKDLDYVHGPQPLISPKDPRYLEAAKALRASHLQVAPLK